jgi:hypothetical protein
MSNRHTFTVDSIAKAARGFHIAAGKLEDIHRAERPRVPFELADLDGIIGTVVGATTLEALAIELVLKARLHQAGIAFPKTHNHADLFAALPLAARQAADQNYQAKRHPAMRATLAEVLNFSANAFEKWRYLHEQPFVEASMGEMQRAFAALIAPLGASASSGTP